MALTSYFLSFLVVSALASALATPHLELKPAELAADLVARAPAQVVTKCTAARTVALTFDDGPSDREVVRQLEAVDGKATFFVNGNNWGCIYESSRASAIKYAYDRGHQIASHTWGHKDLTTLTSQQIYEEMERVDVALERITGGLPAWMRPPYGNHNALVRETSGARGQTIALWDYDSGDSTGMTVDQQKSEYTKLANRNPNNILSIQHDVHRSSVYDVLPHAISVLKAKKYKFVTLADCVGKKKYQRTGPPQGRNVSLPPSFSTANDLRWYTDMVNVNA